MSTIQETNHRPEEQHRNSRPWVWIAIAAVALLALAGIAWVVSDDGNIDTATELATTWGRGWEETDAEAVGSVFTDDGIYIDIDGVEWNKKGTMLDVGSRGRYITKVGPVTDMTATDDGTFTWTLDFTGGGTEYTGVVEIELDGDLASRIEWLSIEEVTDS